jgi:hypothetical protein
LAPLVRGASKFSAAFNFVGCDVHPLTENERALLEKLADAGKPTELGGGEAIVGKTLERAGLVLFTRNSASAVITPKGRHAITAVKFALKPASPKKPPLGFRS